ncbi:MAG: amino acid permease [Verrucomicrobia bacterium]|nr:amino acid permease [Verrucomicrobiota bacterium]
MRLSNLCRVKPLEALVDETERPAHQLRRTLGPVQLTFLGIGAIVGAGIFSTVGTAAAGGPDHVGAGPALVLSFLMVAVACGFAALCYAEFAAMVPVAGSAYTYAYATLGELIAWVIGWDLILEYAVSNAAVAVAWSDYFQVLLRGFDVPLPPWLGTDYRSAAQGAAALAEARAAGASMTDLGAVLMRGAAAFEQAPQLFGVRIVFNLPAFGVVAFVTWLVLIGIRETAKVNTGLAVAKLAIIVFFLGLGAAYVRPEHWTPFAPNGFKGISSAAAIIFFAYIGFDAISTASEEARNPKRDMPIGILASLVICTVIYVAVAVVLTGMVPWETLGNAEPLAFAFESLGMTWTAGIIAAGAVLATTSALIPYQVGQPRIFFAMGRDGLLPPWAAKVHPKFRTPHVTTLLTGVIVAVCSSATNINELVELTNIGTLFAFILVAVGILVLRRRDPDRPRPFRTPWVPWIPLGATVSCLYLMLQLPLKTWIRFGGWLVIGLAIYACYGRRRSRLAHQPPRPPTPRP